MKKKAKHQAPVIESLEPRIMMSADLPGLDVPSFDPNDPLDVDTNQILARAFDAFEAEAVNSNAGLTDAEAAPANQLADEADTPLSTSELADEVRYELVIVDPDVPDYEILLANLTPVGGEDTRLSVVMLDSTRDGIEQIAEILSARTNTDAIHILSHGSQAELILGTARLTMESMTGEYSDELAEINRALGEEADILIYGCNFGEGEQGREATNILATLTGADVAASDDPTGHESLGGDWDLEYKVGDVGKAIAITAEAQNDWLTILGNNAPTDLSSGIELNTDGGNDGYLISNTGLATSLTATTVEIRFAANNIPMETVFMSFNNATDDEFSLQINEPSNELELDFGNGLSGEATSIDYQAALVDGEIHSLAVSWDSTNGDWAVYIDGEYIESGTGLNTGVALDTTNGQFVFGQEQDGQDTGYDPTQHFSGTLYDVRIWNEVRSEADIALNYQHKFASGSLPSGLVANWQMDGFDGSNEVVDIVSGNNLSVGHATGIGFIASTPVEDLHISENANDGDSVGFVAPTDPDIHNDIVSDGLFLEGDTGAWQSYTFGQSFGGWTVVGGGGVDHTSQYPSPLGGVGIDLERGNGDVGGTISQTLTTEIGRQYQIVFAATGSFGGGDAIKHLRVSAAGESQDYAIEDTGVYEQLSMQFVATGTSTDILLQGLGSTGFGAVISDVQVMEVPAAVTTILNDDSTLSYDAGTGKFYRFVDSPTNFDAALSAATSSMLNGLAGQLVTIRSQYENDFVQQYVIDSGNEIWIGTYDTNNDGNWNWLDGNVESNDQFWTGGNAGSASSGLYSPDFYQSEGAGEDYARVISGGEWSDTSENSNFAYIVEWDASEVLSNFTFGLIDASNNFDIDSNTGEITVAAANTLDYETATSHDVDVTVIDAAGNSYLESMTITVDDVADPAFLTVPIAQSVDEDVVLTFSVGGSNAIVVESGSPNDPVLTATFSVTNGMLTLATTNGITFLDGTSDGDAKLTIAGTELAINTALDGLEHVGAQDYNGGDTLTVTIGSSAATEANLHARYEFLNGSINDESGNGYNGTASGDPVLTNDAERGDVMTFDGNDLISITSGTTGLGNEVTFAAWVNLDAGQNDNVFLSIGDEVYVVLDPTTAAYGIGGRVESFTSYSLDSSDRVGGTGWRHVALTFDAVTDSMSVYLDGELTRSTTNANWTPDWAAADSQNITIGGLSDGSDAFVGSIDDVRIYDSAFTESDIIAIMGDNGFDTESVSLTIDPVNDEPIFTTLPAATEAIIDNSVVGASVVTSGDVDNDGDVDLIGATANGQVLWYSNDGNGGYGIGTELFNTAGYEFTSIATGDIDGDGDLDFVVTNFTPDASEDGILVFENQFVDSGASLFTMTSMESTSFDAYDIAIADLDGDTRLDIVASFQSGDVILYEQNTDDVFTRSFAASIAGARGIDVGDVDGDGSLDIAAAGSSGVYWLENDSAASPAFTVQTALTLSDIADVKISQLNGGSDADIAYLRDFVFGAQIGWLESDGVANPIFTQQVITNLTNFNTYSNNLLAADIDASGSTDLVFGRYGSDEILVFGNDGSGTFTQDNITLTPDGPEWVEAADIDGDGDLDLLYAQSGDSTFGVQFNRGSGVYSTVNANEDVTLTGLQVQLDDVDAAGDDLSVTLTVANGIVTIPTGSVTFSGGINSSNIVTFAGTITEINSALNSFSFSPTVDYFGDTSINIAVDDQGNSGSGGSQVVSEELLLHVQSVNDAPIADDDPTAFANQILAQNPVGYWQFGEPSGTTATNLGSSGVDGTYNGPTLGASGYPGGGSDTGSSFNGSSDYLITHDPQPILGADMASVACAGRHT